MELEDECWEGEGRSLKWPTLPLPTFERQRPLMGMGMDAVGVFILSSVWNRHRWGLGIMDHHDAIVILVFGFSSNLNQT